MSATFRNRRTLTKGQALAWRDSWDSLDRRRIDAALSVFPDSAWLYAPPSQSYIAVEVYGDLMKHNDAWRDPTVRSGYYNGLLVYPGRLEWAYGIWNKQLDRDLFPRFQDDEKNVFGTTVYYEWFPLSTARVANSRSISDFNAPAKVCSRCHVALPLTGACDKCD